MRGDSPNPSWGLSDWRFFAFQEFGPDSAAFSYLDELCRKFGVDCKDTPIPEIFFDHIAKLNHSRFIEGKRWVT
jgi:hypothetical protein